MAAILASESQTQKVSERWPFESRTIRLSDVYCILTYNQDPKTLLVWCLNGRFWPLPGISILDVQMALNHSISGPVVIEGHKTAWTNCPESECSNHSNPSIQIPTVFSILLIKYTMLSCFSITF
jgi:hypothetical protein